LSRLTGGMADAPRKATKPAPANFLYTWTNRCDILARMLGKIKWWQASFFLLMTVII